MENTHAYQQILEEIKEVRKALGEMQYHMERMEVDIRNDMNIKHQEIDYNVRNATSMATKHDKLLNWLAGLVATVLITALLYSVLK